MPQHIGLVSQSWTRLVLRLNGVFAPPGIARRFTEFGGRPDTPPSDFTVTPIHIKPPRCSNTLS